MISGDPSTLDDNTDRRRVAVDHGLSFASSWPSSFATADCDVFIRAATTACESARLAAGDELARARPPALARSYELVELTVERGRLVDDLVQEVLLVGHGGIPSAPAFVAAGSISRKRHHLDEPGARRSTATSRSSATAISTATWEWIDTDSEPALRWRWVGTHEILKAP
ncbi:MAG TPA: hypothetical protein VGO81_14110 [Solirubrobacteraceae bacterium]|nr:hypothetical protein [Solirubrobacteraceae bacterium]